MLNELVGPETTRHTHGAPESVSGRGGSNSQFRDVCRGCYTHRETCVRESALNQSLCSVVVCESVVEITKRRSPDPARRWQFWYAFHLFVITRQMTTDTGGHDAKTRCICDDTICDQSQCCVTRSQTWYRSITIIYLEYLDGSNQRGERTMLQNDRRQAKTATEVGSRTMHEIRLPALHTYRDSTYSRYGHLPV